MFWIDRRFRTKPGRALSLWTVENHEQPSAAMTVAGRASILCLLIAVFPACGLPQTLGADSDDSVRILLLGDSTTEGSVPRRLKPQGPHLERVIEMLLAAEEGVPPCEVINSSLSGEYIRRLFDSGRYDRDVATLKNLEFIFVRYGLNDRARRENFTTSFPQDFHELISRLQADHPNAHLVLMTVIPFSNKQISTEINELIRGVAKTAELELFDIYPRYAAELEKNGVNMLNYRRYPLENVPEAYRRLVAPFVHGGRVEVMANELDPILGHLPGWYGDRHPNLAGYNVIAHETARFLVPLLKQRFVED